MAPKKKKGAGKKKGKEKEKKIPSPEPEKPDHPEDILPMVLTSATQELFGCVADEDVTAENPYKLLSKEDIMQDIRNRAGVSDFSPVKQIVADYPDDEMLLLVFDRSFTYGQAFYLVLTPEARDRILRPPEPESPEPAVSEANKTPEPKEWVSLGSEREVDEESVKETREKLVYKFSRARQKFGTPASFSDRNVADARDGFLECASYEDGRSHIKKMQRDSGTQAVPELRTSSAQTQWKFLRNNFTQYVPAELSEEEKTNILQSETLKQFCNSTSHRFLQALQQEEIMNVFTDDWKALGTDEDGDWSGKLSEGLMLYLSFTVGEYTHNKKVSSINWHPTIYGVIAVALTEKEEQANEPGKRVSGPSLILFYSFTDISNPQLLLQCPDDILAFKFCPSDPNIIVGGCVNGQVVLWDISAYFAHLQPSGKSDPSDDDVFDLDDNKEKIPVLRYSAVSALESSHKAPITDVHWLPQTFEVTRTGQPVENQSNISVQLVTCSPDCTLMFWDIRVTKVTGAERKQNADQKPQMTPYGIPNTFKHLDRTWKPMFRISLSKTDSSGEYSPLKLSIDPYAGTGNTGDSHEREGIPNYSQLRAPSGKTLPPLDDVNTKIYIGTEDGEIVYIDWKLEKDDVGQLTSSKPLHCCCIHHGSVNTIQRSPFFKDIILTGTSLAGSSNFAIWKEGVMDGPIYISPSYEQLCTVASWSLTRPAVLFIGKEDGSIDVWNLLEKHHMPALVYAHIANAKITCIEPWTVSSRQHFLAVADDLGVVRIFEIPRILCVPSRNEKTIMKKYFEQEENTLMDFLKRDKEWGKQKKDTDLLSTNKEPEQQERPSVADLQKDYNEYLSLEKSILNVMGLNPAESDDI